ncbi:uncharacterized protein TM35_000421140 [Trypanosoma theileri]|uniref:Uncharacterized protein n=1 Tax=Trypanosoma theileri TaxID=67003 RepID=A0A1X0NJ03_9TRYP|nr:uncharacterized protein TM35_000421140 [Trypanosoma theileri]ORC84656.1 hypothetical protein TM35_000421140 [Trypanosoma theileri]
MRRILSYSGKLNGLEPLMCSQRFVRRRGKVVKEETEQVTSFDLPSFRAGSMLAAPETSLDNIRAEISRMRSDQVKRNEKANEKPVSSTHKEVSSLHFGLSEFMDKLRPSETYCKGHDVIECVKAKDRTARRQLFQDADEVLRKKNKEDTLRYLQLVYGRIGSSHREEVMETVNFLMQEVEKETQRIEMESRETTETKVSSLNGSEISHYEAKEMAWVNILSNMRDEELIKLWKWGLLDFDTIESFVVAQAHDEASEKNLDPEGKEEGNVLTSTSSVSFNNEGKEKVEVKVEEEEEEANLSSSLPIEQNIEALQNVSEIDELTATVYENAFLGLPAIDLAPVMQKVQLKRYEDISERELRLLERYEEVKHTIKLPKNVTSTSNPETSDKDSEIKSEGEKNDSVLFSSKDKSSVNKKVELTKMEVTDAMIDRAFSPSNRFLHAVARYDDALRQSFEGMERIKRRALLDPVFQAAVEEAHRWEELSVQPYLHNDGTTNLTSAAAERINKKQRRLHRTSGVSSAPLLGGPFAKPQHAADIPFFYGNVRSFVPPRGRYNMPAPQLSREEASQLRSAKRKKSRMRYHK